MKRPVVIAVTLLIAIVGFGVWWHYRVPEGVEPMGDGSERVALIGLWTGIVALLTSIVGLLTRMLEMAKAGR